jgi:5-formyltetrahydrofolate cyclo-ligase
MHDSTRESAVSGLQGTALHEAKRAMRRHVLALRDALPPDVRASAAAAIASRVAALPQFGAASAVLLTIAFRGEWDTMPLVLAALANGKVVAVPRVDQRARMLELHAITEPAADIVAGSQGIPEPRLHCPLVPRETIDFVLVPGVAFDASGRRLGYGGGYYDRLLPLLSARAARIAGAFDVQLVPRVPAAPHDVAIDAIVTESQMLVPRVH